MDPVTHAALGAAVAEATLGPYDRDIPWKAGALAALAPDLDVLIQFSEPLSGQLWHRSFTHSVLFIPFGGLIVALVLCCLPYFRKHKWLTLVASILGYATHGLLDACTSYGTQLFWPWPYRISWDIVAIIDPWVTIPLVLGTAWSVIYKEQKAVLGAIVFFAGFFIFNIFQHQNALDAFQTYAQQQKWDIRAVRATPALASSTHWQITAKHKPCIVLANAYTPLWNKGIIANVTLTQEYTPSTSKFSLSLAQQKALKRFKWFTDEYVIVAKTNPLTLADGRYVIGAKPLYSLWGIQFVKEQPEVRELSRVLIEERCGVNGYRA